MLGFRWLAFSCLVWAAFAWPTWLLDREGVALLGAAFVALALGPRVVSVRPSEPGGLPGFPPLVPDDADVQIADLVARVNGATRSDEAQQGWGAGVDPRSSTTA